MALGDHVERFPSGFGEDAHLVGPQTRNDAPVFDDALRAHEHHRDFAHGVGDGRFGDGGYGNAFGPEHGHDERAFSIARFAAHDFVLCGSFGGLLL